MTCQHDECTRTAIKRGFCNTHYSRRLLDGDIRPLTVSDRLWRNVDKGQGPDACWIWQGSVTTRGYGTLRIGNRPQPVHRIAYEQLVGPVPEGMVLDHICRVRRCLNPDHLRPATAGQNMQNLAAVRRGTASGLRGITWHARTGKWVVRVQVAGVRHVGGYFDDLDAANCIAVAMRRQLMPFSAEAAALRFCKEHGSKTETEEKADG